MFLGSREIFCCFSLVSLNLLTNNQCKAFSYSRVLYSTFSTAVWFYKGEYSYSQFPGKMTQVCWIQRLDRDSGSVLPIWEYFQEEKSIHKRHRQPSFSDLWFQVELTSFSALVYTDHISNFRFHLGNEFTVFESLTAIFYGSYCALVSALRREAKGSSSFLSTSNTRFSH